MENNKLKGINVLSKKGLIKSGLAVTVLGTTVAGPFMTAQAAENTNDAKDNTTSTDDKSAKIKVNVDNSKINKAVEDAKNAGLDVKKDADKNHDVKINDVDKTQKEIQADYDKQISDINAKTKAFTDATNRYKSDKVAYDKKVADNKKSFEDATNKYKSDKAAYDKKVADNKAQYDKDKAAYDKEKAAYDKKVADNKAQYDKAMSEYKTKKAAYDDARKNPKFNGGKTEFSEDQLRKFLGTDPANITYISGNTGKKDMKYVNGNLKPITKAELDKFNSELTGDAPPYPDIENDGIIFTKVKKGSTWTYEHALNDGKTGHDVNVKATVQDIKMFDGRSIDDAVIKVNKGSIGLNAYTPIEEITITYDYIDAETGKPIKIDALMGKGDLDGAQYYKLKTDMDSVLKGSKVVQKGDQFWAAESGANYDTGDPSTQVWTISHGVDSQTFTWGTEKYKQGSGEHISDYFVDGAIDFGLELPPVPKEPTKPKDPEPPKEPTKPADPTPPKEPTKPADPTPPKAPEKVSVNYNLHTLNAIPNNHKDVEKGIQKEDTDATINGQKVEVGDQITYPLTNSDLPANRSDEIKSYVMKDKLPEGVTPDKDEIEKNVDKSKWDVKIEGNDITVTATKSLIDEMNKDKTKAFKVPHVGLVATVTKGGSANLDNTFDTIINDQTVKSNKVTNTPPPIVKKEAKKSVSTDKIVEFDESYQYGLDFTVPNDKNYKKVQFKDSASSKSMDFEDVKVYADIPESDTTSDSKSNEDTKSDETKSEDATSNETTKTDNDQKVEAQADETNTKSDDTATEDAKTDDSNTKESDSTEKAKNDENKSDDTATDDVKTDENNGRDITKEGKLEFDKEKDTFTWTANDPTKLLGKKVHIDIQAKLKDGGDLDKFKTNDKDENGNVIYSLPNTGHMVLDNEDTPTNEVPIRVVKAEPSIKKYIVSENNLLEHNKGKEGENLKYQLDVQFGTGTPKSISDELDKEKLDLNDVKIYEDNSKSNETDSNKEDSAKDDSVASDENKSETDSNKEDSTESNESTKSTDQKVENQADETKSEDAKSEDAKSEDAKSEDAKSEDAKSEDAKSEDAKSEDVNSQAFDTKDAKDITKEGKLELNKDNESFTWTPNEPSKFNNKKVKVIIDSTIKKDLKYENGKAQIDNVANLQDGDKKLKSNKVTTELEKKENPEQPQKEQPQKEQPQKEQPQKEQPQKQQESPLPSTGSQTADAILYGAAGLLGLTGLYYGVRRFKNRNN